VLKQQQFVNSPYSFSVSLYPAPVIVTVFDCVDTSVPELDIIWSRNSFTEGDLLLPFEISGFYHSVFEVFALLVC
jgi:hypothetical protein